MDRAKKTSSAKSRERTSGGRTAAGAENFHITEAYKNLRANLLFTLAATSRKSVIVTSAEPDAGKSVTCFNLAKAMVQTGSKVLIIDADMRKPSQHSLFKITNNFGLSRLLSGQDSLEQSIHKNVSENLDLITTGPIPPNPSELLSLESMSSLLAILEEHYHHIFIDSPPINIVSDALVLCGHTTGVLLVARQRQTTYDDIRKAMDNVKKAKSNTLGVVITDIARPKGFFGMYKYRYYDYRSK